MEEIFVYKRVCNTCNEEKGLCEFVKRKGKPTSICYECNNKRTKARYEKSILCTGKGSPWFKDTAQTNIKKLYKREKFDYDY
jgi:hypothetical protein